jgi:hypothetical protein
MATKKSSKKGKTAQKKSSAAASTSIAQEVKEFFSETQQSFRAVKRTHEQTLRAAAAQTVDSTAVAKSLAELNKLGDIADYHLDPDYTLIDPEGNVVPRQRVVDHIRKFGTFEDYKRTKHDVRIYGNTALSVSQVTMSGIFEGHDITGNYRETHLLVKRKGAWVLLNTHMTFVQPMGKLFKKVADTNVTG